MYRDLPSFIDRNMNNIYIPAQKLHTQLKLGISLSLQYAFKNGVKVKITDMGSQQKCKTQLNKNLFI